MSGLSLILVLPVTQFMVGVAVPVESLENIWGLSPRALQRPSHSGTVRPGLGTQAPCRHLFQLLPFQHGQATVLAAVILTQPQRGLGQRG